MPIRNIWSLEPAECIVAEELTNRLRGCQVFFPLHDVGVDLLVVKGEKHLSLQVKESRYYSRRGRRIQNKYLYIRKNSPSYQGLNRQTH